MTPEEVIDLGRRMQEFDPQGAALVFHPMMGGMPLELGRECLDLVAREVMPALRT